MLTVKEMWRHYSKMTLQGVPEGSTQWKETRRAFVSGIFCLLSHQKQDLPDDEAQAVAILSKLEEECMQFFFREVHELTERVRRTN